MSRSTNIQSSSEKQSARNSARTFSALVATASVIALFSYRATGVNAAPRGPYILLFLIGVACLIASILLRRLPVYGFNLISLVSLVGASIEDIHTNLVLS